jgi:hypothetical protein
MSRPAFVLLLLAGLAGPVMPTVGAATAPATPTLTALEARYQAHLLAARPDLASHYGLGGDDRLAPITEVTLARDAAWLRSFAADVARLDAQRLSAREHARADSLRARVAREAAPLEDRTWQQEPRAYLALVHAAVLEAGGAPHVSPCERGRRAMMRLRMVPEVLRSALINLRATHAMAPEAAAAFDSAAADLRIVLFKPLDGCKDPRRQADVIAADTLALRAYASFVADLRAFPAAERAR